MECRDCKHHQGRRSDDLFTFFKFEASGDSEGDSFPDDPNIGCFLQHHCHYGGFCSSAVSYGEATAAHEEDDLYDDAESCVLGLSYNLHDKGGDDLNDEITPGKDASHKRRPELDLQATSKIDQNRRDFDSGEMSCISDDSNSRGHLRPLYPLDREEPSGDLSDGSISNGQLGRRHNKLLKEKEKDKLFWEACLAS
ncbi:hypothetical protein SAY87_025162 [Trapa incisa]|uniref:Uncharacterized protein n=1 Tax=Trapa incisa TaxID=236973 RepID=A0AAN7GH41_9MYRT|nr:hypothetical protein SAY87_025162 [Trapa incisa]